MQSLIAIATIGLYLASFVLLLRKTRQHGAITPFLTTMLAGMALHAAFLHFSIFRFQHLHLNFYSVSPLIFFVIAIISLVSLLRRQPTDNLLLFYFPLASLGIAFAAWVPASETKIITEPGLIAHIVLSILAYSMITIAALHAVMLTLQEHALKKHHFTGVFRFLPALQTMELLLFEMLVTGFILLTLAIASGFAFLDDMFAQHLAHKTILSIIAWLIFATLLVGRQLWGWRGKIATRWTLGGFVALMLAYFGSKFVLEILLTQA